MANSATTETRTASKEATNPPRKNSNPQVPVSQSPRQQPTSGSRDSSVPARRNSTSDASRQRRPSVSERTGGLQRQTSKGSEEMQSKKPAGYQAVGVPMPNGSGDSATTTSTTPRAGSKPRRLSRQISGGSAQASQPQGEDGPEPRRISKGSAHGSKERKNSVSGGRRPSFSCGSIVAGGGRKKFLMKKGSREL